MPKICYQPMRISEDRLKFDSNLDSAREKLNEGIDEEEETEE